LKPKLTDGASALVSFDGAALSKPNIGPALVNSFNWASAVDSLVDFDWASAPDSSVEGTKVFPKLNRGGLAADPFGVDLSESKIVCVDALTEPVFGLAVEPATIDEVIGVGVSTFSSTIEPSAFLSLPSAIKLLDDDTTDEPGGVSCTGFSMEKVVFSAAGVEKGDAFSLG